MRCLNNLFLWTLYKRLEYIKFAIAALLIMQIQLEQGINVSKNLPEQLMKSLLREVFEGQKV